MDDDKSKVNIDEIKAELKRANVKFTEDFVNKFIDVIYQMVNDLAYENERRQKKDDSRALWLPHAS